ncbi:uncharacterized protein [Miscanthus floridulus]|uniref:uncharacterized protein n=1 Tax=Miscanthus floridulus TaxID=154761 RepID=UPI003458A945
MALPLLIIRASGYWIQSTCLDGLLDGGTRHPAHREPRRQRPRPSTHPVYLSSLHPASSGEAHRDPRWYFAMSTPRDACDALSDITNIADEASRKREERNMQQRIRRAEMSSEQIEEMKRKKCEYMRDYRARKKATSQNSSTSCALTETVPTTTPMENIPPNAHGNHGHVGIGTTTTSPGSALFVANDIANDKMDEKNAQQRKRRAKMTDEQRKRVKGDTGSTNVNTEHGRRLNCKILAPQLLWLK